MVFVGYYTYVVTRVTACLTRCSGLLFSKVNAYSRLCHRHIIRACSVFTTTLWCSGLDLHCRSARTCLALPHLHARTATMRWHGAIWKYIQLKYQQSIRLDMNFLNPTETPYCTIGKFLCPLFIDEEACS